MRAHGLLTVIATLGALATAGCGGGPARTPDGSPTASSGRPRAGEGHPTSPADARTIRWSIPLHYHGLEVRIELPPGAEASEAKVERFDAGDRLVSGDTELAYRFQRFEVPGGSRVPLAEGSRVFLFRPPSAETPWSASGDGFELYWEGDGVSPVLQEERADGTVIWHLGRTRITRARDGTLVHHHRGQDRSYDAPAVLVIGPRGEVLEHRRSAR